MVKSILINENIHRLIVDKQYELQKTGIKIGLSELAERLIKENIDKFNP